ncbi:MAG: N-acetylmuramoyl-L-alanine amidase LytC [Peptostreptococcus russellii]
MNKLFIKSLTLSMALLFTSSIPVFADMNVSRISGYDRYETAMNISKKYFETSDAVIIASGEKFPDALIGGSLSTQISAPILLTKNFNTSDKLLEEINRLSPDSIYLLGGNLTIEEINKLRDKLYYANPEEDVDGITIHYFADVNGNNFYDALYSAPYFGFIRTEYDMLLYLSLIPYETIKDSDRISANVIGDINVIYDEPEYPYVNQTRGKNKYETSALIANRFKKHVNTDLDTVIITSGDDYPDGLSSAGVSAVEKAPILLTNKYKLDSSVKNFIKENNIKNVIIVGGEKSISKNVENELKSFY